MATHAEPSLVRPESAFLLALGDEERRPRGLVLDGIGHHHLAVCLGGRDHQVLLGRLFGLAGHPLAEALQAGHQHVLHLYLPAKARSARRTIGAPPMFAPARRSS